jgi:hypothetical protein
MVSGLHVVTVEMQRYAFLLFSVVMTVATGEFLDIRVSFLQHAMSCSHGKLFCIKLISLLSSALSFRKEIPFISLRNQDL